MIKAIRHLFRQPSTRPAPAIPDGERVYAIGDIHGRLDLFAPLVAAIERDDGTRGDAGTTIVLLGDLIDRGPDSSGVIEAARSLQARRKVRIITGNHEEMFLEAIEDIEVLRHFLRFGGSETVLSYPVDRGAFAVAEIRAAQDLMRAAVPETDLAFMRSFEDGIAIGGYFFVHAGVRPGKPISAQDVQEMRWIREPFLSHRGDHGFVVVHGHTIVPEPEVFDNRIGIDTGAYMSGRLTALGLEGTQRWLIEAVEDGGAISISTRPA